MKRNFSITLLLLCATALFSMTAPGCKSKTSDTTVKSSVESALRADPQTSGVMVDIKDGVATISGTVRDAAAQAAAATIAAGVKGVKSVQNNVTVEAPPTVEITADDPLTSGVRDATKDYPGVTTTINDGVITVTGELSADSWKKLKMALDGLSPKKVDASGLKIK